MTAVTALGMAAPSQAQSGDSLRPIEQCVPMDARLSRGVLERGPDVPLRISADRLSSTPDLPIEAAGGVVLVQGDQRLRTERISYDPSTGRVELPVALSYQDAVIEIEAQQAWLNPSESRGEFRQVNYRLAGAEGSGHAESVSLLTASQAHLRQFDFTTCDPARPAWQLHARSVNLDMDTEVGVARGAKLVFYGVPLLYSPWLSFPLSDDRKSGFLYPSFGFSSSDGFDLSVPWYWNIAPHRDATLTPRWIEKRGVMLGTEYRFLGHRQRGQLNLDVLPDDRRFDGDRYHGRLDYAARPAPEWRLDARLQHASDDDYFLDLGSGLDDSAIQFLRSDVRLRSAGPDWRLNIMADSVQVLDPGVLPQNVPYRRLPSIHFNFDRAVAGSEIQPWRLQLDSELVYFQRRDRIDGARLDVMPRLSKQWGGPGWFARPELALRSTHYAIDDDRSTTLSRNMPLASVDAGLFFDRILSDGSQQTLEPRLFYLWVPERDQSDIPVFDTRNTTFGLSQLFQTNRFTGPDRQGDANQLAVSLTSSVSEAATGRTRLDVTVAQIFYFDDLRVQLPDRAVEERSVSATLLTADWFPRNNLRLGAGVQYDVQEDEIEQAELTLGYRGRDQRQVALGYRFRRDRIDQFDARFRYPVWESFNVLGRVTYSFEDNDALELLGGIEYESCCWALTLTLREYIRDRESDKRSAVFLVLHLKGLGSLGRQPYPLFGARQR